MGIAFIGDAIRLDVVFCVITIVLLFRVLRWARLAPKAKGTHPPPGPKGLPIVGNMLDLPKHDEWVETFARWKEEYGDIVYIKIFGQPIICANTSSIAHELFETRSSIYSDRPQFPMLNGLMGANWNFSLMPYGERWRRHRKAFQQHFSPTAAVQYYDVHVKHTQALLWKLYRSPDDFVEHFRYLMGSVVMEIVYGIEVLPTQDPYIDLIDKAFASVAEAGNPGTFLVDTLPILKYVPEWLPGASFKKKARQWRALLTNVVNLPFLDVKRAIDAGTAKHSVTASLLEELAEQANAPADEEELIRNTSGAAYGAGTDTTISALSSFILAMVLYPEVQRKAQAEIDSVIGHDRLPAFADRDKLPYINALCKETLRCYPVAPFGVAHRVTQDDVYGDFFIPEGSIVLANAWAILHDEMMYPEPDKFIPERFLDPDVKDPIAGFGFGRRICPGRHMAENSIFMAVASILKVFNISHAIDGNGNIIPVEASFRKNLVSYPEPFSCAITLRSPSTESVLFAGTDD